MDKKAQKLGMNYSTAANRLRKDLLFHFVMKAGHKCFRCGGDLTKDTFSIEHTVPWLNSDDPVKNFFDIEQIAFSHESCNYASRGNRQDVYTDEERAAKKKESQKRWQTPERRREKYLRLGN